ncbi:MAG: hypothetical protein Kow00127_20260 [Bacteroidales bacterium]
MPDDLHCVKFYDTLTGYAGGRNGTLLVTRDGGMSWNRLFTGYKQTIRSVWFISPDTGFIAGDEGLFSMTRDGGKSWSDLSVGWNDDFTSIFFVDSHCGYITGHGMNGSVFGVTCDGGRTWSTGMINELFTSAGRDDVDPEEEIYLTGSRFINRETGIVYGYGYSYRYGKRPLAAITRDGGISFTDISPEFQYKDWFGGLEVMGAQILNEHDAFVALNRGTGSDFLYISDYRLRKFNPVRPEVSFDTRGHYFSFRFLDNQTGYFAGVINGQPRIIKTIDQGYSFMMLIPPTDRLLFAMDFPASGKGIFVGQNGTILLYTDPYTININPESRDLAEQYDPPYAWGFTFKDQKRVQVHVYNFKGADKKRFRVELYDRYGRPIPLKQGRIKSFSDETRIRFRTEGLGNRVCFYTVTYDNVPLVNGTLNVPILASH